MALVLALAPRLGSKSAKTESIIWCHLGSQTKACQGYYQIHNDIATFVQFSCLLHEFYSSISKAVNIMIQCTLQPTHYMQHHYTRLEYVVSWRCLQVTYQAHSFGKLAKTMPSQGYTSNGQNDGSYTCRHFMKKVEAFPSTTLICQHHKERGA